jgi:Tfp pilus assembly protein PilF
VTDTNKKPLPDVKISIVMKEQPTWKKEVATDSKGNYEVSFTDGTKNYLFQLSKDDYLLVNEESKTYPSNTDEVKPKIFASLERNFIMSSKAELDKKAREEEIKRNPYIKYYEDGKTALLAGNKAEARKQFEACLKEKPEYTKVVVILASLDEEDGKHDAAIEKAQKALSAKDAEDTPAALKVLIRAYNAKGDKAKALEYQKLLDAAEPDSPESLYNKAAALLNKKDDAGAKPLLEKALEMKSDFADALYELGFIYLREENTAKSKETFEQFLKLVPSGEKAEIAKETIKWL